MQLIFDKYFSALFIFTFEVNYELIKLVFFSVKMFLDIG
ncbi:hypothetical protein NU08_4598 [Flavobacterium anhuiense]|uniref:Uncharacterized protein n=1 Tax=Flavobacterium anhuiense TaxID=459526 RepID=A0A444VSD7_9FLAO|nr:hypothetical protein NU08_4598 [Flavobacterium anhuiense]